MVVFKNISKGMIVDLVDVCFNFGGVNGYEWDCWIVIGW